MRFLPSVRAVHVLLEPGLEVSQLVLSPVHHLHGSPQVPTAQAVVDQSPDWVTLHLTILFIINTHSGVNLHVSTLHLVKAPTGIVQGYVRLGTVLMSFLAECAAVRGGNSTCMPGRGPGSLMLRKLHTS